MQFLGPIADLLNQKIWGVGWPRSLVFVFLSCLWQHLWHMDVLRLGVGSELQLHAHTTAMATPDKRLVFDPCCSLQQCHSLTQSETKDQTHTLTETALGP